MRRHQGGDDGQPEPGAAGLPRAGRVRPVEALEGPVGVGRVHARALVGHPQHQDVRIVVRRHGHGHPGVGRGVGERVGDQVADHLPQPGLVAQHDRDVGERLVQVQGDRAGRLDGAGVVDGVAGDLGEVDGADGERPLLVQPGQQQQVLDEQAHAGALGLDAAHQAPDVVLRAHGALAVELGEAADRGQRRPQLVAGVGDEAAHPVLGAAGLRLGGLLGPEGALDPGEHAVERRRQPADLGPVVARRARAGTGRRRRSPAAVRSTSASGRRLLRTSRYPATPRTTSTISPTTTCERDQLADRGLVAAEVGADDEGVPAVQVAGDHPPVRPAVGRAAPWWDGRRALRPPSAAVVGPSPQVLHVGQRSPSLGRAAEHRQLAAVGGQAGDVGRARAAAAPSCGEAGGDDVPGSSPGLQHVRSSASCWSTRYPRSMAVAPAPVATRARATRTHEQGDEGDPQRHPAQGPDDASAAAVRSALTVLTCRAAAAACSPPRGWCAAGAARWCRSCGAGRRCRTRRRWPRR